VIARGTLNGFVRIRVDRKLRKMVKGHLDAWYAEAAKATWKSSAELKRNTVRQASFLMNMLSSTSKGIW
jgi:mRNA-degrading endonuclease HigB of HigAB toxin-antitoxin module